MAKRLKEFNLNHIHTMSEEVEHTHRVIFTKGRKDKYGNFVVGARSTRMVHVTAQNQVDAEREAMKNFPSHKADGYEVTDVKKIKSYKEEVESVDEAAKNIKSLDNGDTLLHPDLSDYENHLKKKGYSGPHSLLSGDGNTRSMGKHYLKPNPEAGTVHHITLHGEHDSAGMTETNPTGVRWRIKHVGMMAGRAAHDMMNQLNKKLNKEEVVVEATNIKNVAGLKKVSSHGDFDLHKGENDEHLLVHRETGEVHHGFSGKTKDVQKFLKNYEFENLPRPVKEEVESVDEAMTKKQKVMSFMSHDPEAGKSILAIGNKARKENKAFKSGKSEINRLKKMGEETELDEVAKDGSKSKRWGDIDVSRPAWGGSGDDADKGKSANDKTKRWGDNAATKRWGDNAPMKKSKNIKEDHDEGDYEFEMARNELNTAERAIERIMAIVGQGEGNLEAWVQSKITKGSDYLDTVADYLESQQKSGD